MNLNEYCYGIIKTFHDEYAKDNQVTICCFIETDRHDYIGNFVFDENLIIPNVVTLSNPRISESINSDNVMAMDEVYISFDTITSFSYKINHPSRKK